MSFKFPKFPAVIALQKQSRPKVQHYSFLIPLLAPGERYFHEFVIREAFRPYRLTANAKASPPDFKYYQRGVGGSKRRGRLASLRFHAELLCHPHRTPRLSIDDVRIGAYSQFAGEGIPIQVFEPSTYTPNVIMDVAAPGKAMAFSFTNHEFSRSVSGAFACFGNVIE